MCETFQLDTISNISIENIEFDEESGKYVRRRQADVFIVKGRKYNAMSTWVYILTNAGGGGLRKNKKFFKGNLGRIFHHMWWKFKARSQEG